METSNWVIYGLRIVGATEFRYIGYTVNKKNRLKSHLASSKSGTKTALYDWMRSHLDESFELEVIERCPEGDKDFIYEREMFWIRHYRELQGGLRDRTTESYLLNDLDGGGGSLGMSHTPESKARISSANLGRKWSDDSRNKLKETLAIQGGTWKGREFSEEHRSNLSVASSGENNHFFGKSHTKETKDMIAAANSGENSAWFGKNHSEETKQKIRESNLGLPRASGEDVGTSKLTGPVVLEIRDKFDKQGYTVSQLVKEYSISNSQVRRIVRRESWKHLQ